MEVKRITHNKAAMIGSVRTITQAKKLAKYDLLANPMTKVGDCAEYFTSEGHHFRATAAMEPVFEDIVEAE